MSHPNPGPGGRRDVGGILSPPGPPAVQRRVFFRGVVTGTLVGAFAALFLAAPLLLLPVLRERFREGFLRGLGVGVAVFLCLLVINAAAGLIDVALNAVKNRDLPDDGS